MTGYRKNKTTSLTLFLLIIGLLVVACEKEEEPPKVIVAKVGNSVLTEERLDSLLSFSQNKEKYREEVIRRWVDAELLYMGATEEGITKEYEYLELVNSSNKGLAGAMYVNSILKDQPSEVDEQKLLDYYFANQGDFKITAPAYVFNKAIFNDESKAILFRSTLNESDWNKAANVFEGDKSVISIIPEVFKYVYEITSKKENVILRVLEKGEVSIIFESKPGEYNVIQLVSEYRPGTIPNLKYIKKKVIDQYVSSQKAKEYEELLQNLYSKYDVLINR